MARTTKGSGSAGRKAATAKNIAKAAASAVVGAPYGAIGKTLQNSTTKSSGAKTVSSTNSKRTASALSAGLSKSSALGGIRNAAKKK